MRGGEIMAKERKAPRERKAPEGMPKNTGATLKRVVAYVMEHYKIHYIAVVICIIFSTLVSLVGTLAMRTLIDDYIVPLTKQAVPDYSPLARIMFVLMGILLLGVAASYIYNRIMITVSQGTMKRLRIELFTGMEELPISYFDTHAHGDIMSVYTNDVDTLRQVISQTVPQFISSAISLIGSLVAMIVLDIPLTIVSLLMVFLMFRVSMMMAKRSGEYFKRQQSDLGAVNGYIEEMISGQKVVKVFCHEEQAVAGFKKLNDQLCDSANNANRIASMLMPVNGNLGNLSYVLCAVLGAILALNGHTSLTVGTLVSFLALSKGFSQPVARVSQQLNSIVMAAAGAERVFDIMDQPPEEDHGYVELVNAIENPDGTLTETTEKTGVWAWKHPHQADGTVSYKKLEGDVTFDGVDFGYTPEKTVLHDIKMYATPGQKIAFVGSTGAGKTTITNLINRFYDIQDGKIRYDGININKIRKSDLRRSLGMVLQDTHLFTGTVMENIRYGRLDATDAECIRAAKLANADGFIRRLENGYNTMLTGDGGNLSQGERQLLAIARAAVADPPVLILDEATSSIDTRTEALVQKGMDALMHGRTSFVIAHRLSTVRDADCIMVLEQGRIIERGTHQQLLEQKGRYYQLYTGNQIESE